MRRPPLGPRADPNAAFARLTNYRDFVRASGTRRAVPKQYPILLEITPHDTAAVLARLRAHAGWTVPPIYVDTASSFPEASAFATAVLDRTRYEALLDGRMPEGVLAWELQLPVIPGRPARPDLPGPATGILAREPGAADAAAALPRGERLFGMIDSVCPFARADLQRAGGGCRIVRLWDQDDHPAFTARGAKPPPGFGRGAEVDRVQLEALIARFADALGTVDEDACYRDARYLPATRDFGHGAAVLGLLAGPVPMQATHRARPDELPRWGRISEPAADADIVFVQLPRDNVQDASSAGLPRCLLDGLRYIVDAAGPGTRRIVVNISDGTSRTAHDGGSMIERAMLALIRDLAARRIELKIVVAAGNAFAEQRHAYLQPGPVDQPGSVWMRLPPDSESPTFVTLGIPDGLANVAIGVVAPDSTQACQWVRPGQAVSCAGETDPTCWVVYPQRTDGVSSIALVVWAPTASLDGSRTTAPCGSWRIDLTHDGEPGDANKGVDLWISRNQNNPGALPRAQQAHFLDSDGCYDPVRYLRECEDEPGLGSAMHRRGTLNGLATMAPGQGVVVVGSRMLRQDRPSLYSSAGPLPDRGGVDVHYPTDFSRTLAGIRVRGTLSGRVVRAEGTSFAAPQAARALLDGKVPPFPPKPKPRRKQRP